MRLLLDHPKSNQEQKSQLLVTHVAILDFKSTRYLLCDLFVLQIKLLLNLSE